MTEQRPPDSVVAAQWGKLCEAWEVAQAAEREGRPKLGPILTLSGARIITRHIELIEAAQEALQRMKDYAWQYR